MQQLNISAKIGATTVVANFKNLIGISCNPVDFDVSKLCRRLTMSVSVTGCKKNESTVKFIFRFALELGAGILKARVEPTLAK